MGFSGKNNPNKTNPLKLTLASIVDIINLIGGLNPSEKYESQMG